MKFPNKAFFLAAIICLSLPNQLKSAKTNTESSTEHNVHGFAHHVHGIAHHVPRYARSVVHQHVQGRVIPEVPIMPVAEVPVVSSLVTPLPILHKRSELITPLVESPVRHDIVKPLLWVEVVQNSCGSCSNNSCNSCASSCESRCPFQMPIRPQGSCMRCVRRCSCSSSYFRIVSEIENDFQ